MSDRARLIDEIAAEVMRRLNPGARGVRDQVCADCTGTCAQRCAFKMPDFLGSGVDRIGAAPGIKRVAADVARIIDHTLLRPDATRAEIDRLCDEAAEHGFASVCVNPTWVEHAAGRLHGRGVAVCTVIGFPLGANRPEVKAEEARRAQNDGAVELDMVINVGRLKSGDADAVRDDIAAVVGARRPGSLVKVIIETCYLNDVEKELACRAARAVGADFVKTSTGFGSGGATVADVTLMRRVVGSGLGVKASGGVRDWSGVQNMLRAGASRIGASAGVRIVKEAGA